MMVQIAKFPDILHRSNWVMVGAAGVGKTEILKQLAEAINFNFMEFPIGFMSRGDSFIPVPGKNGHYMMQLAEFWARVGPNTLLVMDELLNADNAVAQEHRPFFYPGTGERTVAGVPIKGPIMVVGTGNDRKHGGNPNSLFTHPADRNRFIQWHMQDDPKKIAPAWIKNYAIPAGVDDRVWGWIDRNRDMILTDPPKNPEEPYCTPRSVTTTATFLEHMGNGLDTQTVKANIIASIGEQAQRSLWADMSSVKLPSPADLLSGKEPLSDHTSKQVQCVVRTARHVVGENDKDIVRKFIEVSKGWPKEPVASAFPVINGQPQTWMMDMEYFESMEDNPEWVEQHMAIWKQAEVMWKKREKAAKA